MSWALDYNVHYNQKYQTGYNGPLTATLRNRLHKAKDRLNLTLAQVGARMDFSGPFMSQLLRAEDPARMRTKHAERVAAALEEMEAEAGLGPPPGDGKPARPTGVHSLEDLVRAAHRLGFEVSFKPLGR
jgi:hypothetical protein